MGNRGCGGSSAPPLEGPDSKDFRVLPFLKFKEKGKFPLFARDYDDTVSSASLSLETSLVVYVSCNSATFGAEMNEMYHLTLQGIERIHALYTTGTRKAMAANTFLYVDYSCQYDDVQTYTDLLASGLKYRGPTLYDIMAVCDCVLTPILLPRTEAAVEAVTAKAAAAEAPSTDLGDDTLYNFQFHATPHRSNREIRSAANPNSSCANSVLCSSLDILPGSPSRDATDVHIQFFSSTPTASQPATSPPTPPYGYPHSYLADTQAYWSKDCGAGYLHAPLARLELLLAAEVPLSLPKDTKKAIFKRALATARGLGRRLHLVYASELASVTTKKLGTSVGRPVLLKAMQYGVDASAALLVLPCFCEEYKAQLRPADSLDSHAVGREVGARNKVLYLLQDLSARPRCLLVPGKTSMTSKAAVSSPTVSQPLPLGWEERLTNEGRVFFVDHVNRKTSWERPVINPNSVANTSYTSSCVTQVFPNGAVYVGALNGNDRFSGTGGCYVSSSYDRCSGSWLDGCLDGDSCIIEYANADEYRGAFVRNKREGFGNMEYPCGSYYRGLWVKGIRQGDGKSFDKRSGNSFVGQFSAGLPDGHGTLTYQDGSIFVGTFLAGKRHGKGKLIRKWLTKPAGSVQGILVDEKGGAFREKEEYEVREGLWSKGELQLN